MSSLTDSIPGRRTGLVLSSAMQLLLRLKGDQTRLIGEATNDVTRSGLRAEPGVSFGDDAGNKAWGNTLKPRFANELGSETQLNNRTFSPWGSCQIPSSESITLHSLCKNALKKEPSPSLTNAYGRIPCTSPMTGNASPQRCDCFFPTPAYVVPLDVGSYMAPESE